MRLSLSLFGHEIITLTAESDTEAEYEDNGADLSGGYLGSERIDAGPTTLTMGFTMGLEDE